MAEGVLQFNLGSMVEDVLQQHGKRLSDMDLASRKAHEASLRRYDAAGWLRKMAGVVAAKDLPAEPSEEDFRLGLRSGIILCNVLNKVHPGAVSKVVEAPPDTVMIPDGAALTAFQYFENVRNFLVAIEEMGIPTFEASDLEQGGKSSRIVNCILALKSYNEWKKCGGIGLWKFSGNSKSGQTAGKQVVRKHSDLFLNFISRNLATGDKSFDSLSSEDNSYGDDAQNNMSNSHSLHILVRELLADKSREDIPMIVENMLSKVMEEIECRLTSQNISLNGSIQTSSHVKKVPSSSETEEIEATNDDKCTDNTTQDDKRSENTTQDDKCSANTTQDEKCSANTTQDEKCSANTTQDDKLSENTTQDDKGSENTKQDDKGSANITQDDKRSANTTQDNKRSKNSTQGDKLSANITQDEKHSANTTLDDKRSANTTQDDKRSANTMQDKRLSEKDSENRALTDRNRALKDCNRTLTDRNQALTDHNHALTNRLSKHIKFVDHQHRGVQELKNLLQSTKDDMQLLRMKYQEEFNSLGKHLNTMAHAANGYKKVLEENRKLYNQVQDLKGNIRVYCRIRPFLPGQANGSSAVEDIGESTLTIVTPSKVGKGKKSFTFNRVFGPSASQEEVFADTQPLIRSVLDGYNVCIFAYGQTGSGKTFTMTGPKELTKETLGVNYRALSDLFQISEQRKDVVAYDISVQMMEIYNEQVRDLLATDGGVNKRSLEIRNNTSNGINVPNANLVPVTSTSDVINLMNLGHKNRAVGSTLMNDRSSRSHSCLTVHVQGKDLTSGAVLRGCMHLVDLAGSERLDKTEAIGDRLKEAQHINRSLSALGDVISSLALKQSHVPYRNSKLTQLLQDSLGGKAKTLMFVHISPEPDALGETISTLKFAERVSTVELGAAKANKEGSDVKELKEQVATLKAALADRQGIKSSGSSPSHLSWDSIEDVCKTEGQSNSSSTSRRHSLDPQDLLTPWPPLGSSPELIEEEKGVSGDWDDKIMVSKANAQSPEIFYQNQQQKSPNKIPGNSRRHSLDNGLARTTTQYEAVATDYSDDLEIATSDSSEQDYQSQLNIRKSNSAPNVAPKVRKASPKPTKTQETRSQIPQPTRRASNGAQSPLQKNGRQTVSAAGRRKPANAK